MWRFNGRWRKATVLIGPYDVLLPGNGHKAASVLSLTYASTNHLAQHLRLAVLALCEAYFFALVVTFKNQFIDKL